VVIVIPGEKRFFVAKGFTGFLQEVIDELIRETVSA
jgi:hypothetical protein